MATPDEKILGFPRALFEQLGVFHGFCPNVERYLPVILDAKNNSFRLRAQAETDPSFKQIIPYVVITDGERVLHYVRGKKAGEQRLVAKGSIGIGGHINLDQDHAYELLDRVLVNPADTFRAAVEREVREELNVEGAFDAKPTGLINDDTTEVGQVHFGIVHVLRRRPEQVKKREQVIAQQEWLTAAELRDRRERMETWSQFCLDNLDSLLR
jgi:predicted NUDIX family phosphoesterase